MADKNTALATDLQPSPLELHALKVVAKGAEGCRADLPPGLEQPVDFTVRICGQLHVASPTISMVTAGPKKETLLALLLQACAPSSRARILRKVQAACEAFVAGGAEPYLPEEIAPLVTTLLQVTSRKDEQRKNGAVSGKLTAEVFALIMVPYGTMIDSGRKGPAIYCLPPAAYSMATMTTRTPTLGDLALTLLTSLAAARIAAAVNQPAPDKAAALALSRARGLVQVQSRKLRQLVGRAEWRGTHLAKLLSPEQLPAPHGKCRITLQLIWQAWSEALAGASSATTQALLAVPVDASTLDAGQFVDADNAVTAVVGPPATVRNLLDLLSWLRHSCPTIPKAATPAAALVAQAATALGADVADQSTRMSAAIASLAAGTFSLSAPPLVFGCLPDWPEIDLLLSPPAAAVAKPQAEASAVPSTPTPAAASAAGGT